jgi:hypothetical protein
MSQYRTIEIDIDVHKLIEAERHSFNETDNEVLRRLLRLPKQPRANEPMRAAGPRSWLGRGATLPHGTDLRMSYSGQEYRGEIVDGEWVVNGNTFHSPSGAAKAVATTKAGDHTSLNGWGYWEVRLPGDTKWKRLEDLRRRRTLTQADADELASWSETLASKKRS